MSLAKFNYHVENMASRADVAIVCVLVHHQRAEEGRRAMQVVGRRIRCFRRRRARQSVMLVMTLMGALSVSMCSVPRSVWTGERFA